MTSKRCTRCGKQKPLTSEFYFRDRSKKSGFGSRCKACVTEVNKMKRKADPERFRSYSLKWRTKNRGHHLSVRREYRKKHRDAILAAKRAYYQENRERLLEDQRLYRADNPEVLRVRMRRRRARLRNAKGDHTAQDVERQYRKQDGRCHYCGTAVDDDFHVDHVIPLSRGGSNGPENIVIACPTCNLSKNDKLPSEWLPQHGLEKTQ